MTERNTVPACPLAINRQAIGFTEADIDAQDRFTNAQEDRARELLDAGNTMHYIVSLFNKGEL